MQRETEKLPIIGLISAETLSSIGNQIAAVAIPILVLEYTQSPIATGIANMGNVIPIIIAALIGGRAIDRFNARTLSITSDVLSFLSVLALPLAITHFTQLSPAWIFLLVFAGALFDPTGVAARQTLVPALARRGDQSLEKINTIRGGLENGADFIGPTLGVALIGLIGILNTFFINAISFLISAILVLFSVPTNTQTEKNTEKTDFLVGFQFIWRNPQLRLLSLMGMALNFIVLPYLGLLLPVLTTQVLHTPVLLGISMSVFGGCATIGAFSFSKINKYFSRSTIYFGGIFLTALSIGLTGIFPQPALIVILAGFAGLLLGAGNPLEQTILQEQTPEPIMGQVFTVFSATRFAIGPIGLLLAGFGTEWSNVYGMLIASGLFLMVSVFIGRFFSTF